jgi:hypothetical protein
MRATARIAAGSRSRLRGGAVVAESLDGCADRAATGGLRGPHTPKPKPAPTHAGAGAAADEEQHRKPGDDRGVARCAEALEQAADLREDEPARAEELRRARLLRVAKVVVVALERETVAVYLDDAVEDVPVQLVAPVSDHLAEPVARLPAQDDEVAAVEVRLHARAVDDGVRRAAAELDRGEIEPGGHRHGDDGEERRDAERASHRVTAPRRP